MKDIKILGYGLYKPTSTLTNEDLSEIVDTNDEWITTRTGIKNRYISKEENTSVLAYNAALNAIKDANIDKTKIKHIIVATMTPDNFTPSTACLVQEMLGLNDCEVTAFDINAACSGFIYALNIAKALTQENSYTLVIGAEVISKLIDYTDRNTCVLFGDGAGAIVISKEETNQSYFYTRSIGDNKDILIAKGIDLTTKQVGYLNMDGKEVFRFAIKVMNESIVEVLNKANMNINDIDLIIPHQANIRIISHVAKKLQLDISKFYVNLQEFGNTSAASIPLALTQAYQEGIIKEGMNVIMVGFGAGFTYGATLIKI